MLADTREILPKEIMEKMKLKRKQDQELRVYFMIARKAIAPNQMEEKIAAILAYTLEDALMMAKKDHTGFSLFYTGQKMTVESLLERINDYNEIVLPTESSEIEKPAGEVKVDSPETPAKEKIGIDQFKNSLMLAMDEYVEGKDKIELGRIIKGLDKKVLSNKSQ